MRTRDSHELGSNFFDYQNDKEALVHEDEVAAVLTEQSRLYDDPAFPASAGSLYRTPQQPPAGTLPPSLAVWSRICRQEIRKCHSPVTFPSGEALSAVVQGALEDSWLVSALNILLTFPETLKKIVVSDRHRDRGIYTLKLFKEGSWRYVHVDDRIPCSPSRSFYFCSAIDATQVWAPLIEKAVAKLHGCYESLGRGSIEQGLRCLTGEAVLRISLERLTLSGGGGGGSGGGDDVERLDATTTRRLPELWLNMKRWQDRGCVAGCCRSADHDRARSRQRNANTSKRPCGGRRQTGLIVGRGYGVKRVYEASAPATPTLDAVKVKLVQVCCPWGLGHWRGDWSSDSDLWNRYSSIDAELRPDVSATAGDGKASEAGENGKARATTTFWMSLEDFASEFSQVFICASYSAGKEPKGLSRKSYRGRWMLGDPLSGSGGGCMCPTFLQRNSTTVTVCLSVLDRGWQADPSRERSAIGYYIVRLTGSKPRLTNMSPRKVAARSAAFMIASQSAGEHTLDSGRYAVVPISVKPLQTTEAFLLDLSADKAVEWEQLDDKIHDLDQDLRISDDEGGAPISSGQGGSHRRTRFAEETIESEDVDGPPGNKVAEAVHEQIADLSNLVAELMRSLQQQLREGD